MIFLHPRVLKPSNIYKYLETKFRIELKEVPYQRRETIVAELPENYIKVLDKGYVGLVQCFGTELDIVNAARLSYDKRSGTLNDGDIRLLNFLIREDHTSPLRHVYLSFQFKSPLFVARQHWRHIVGASTLEDGTPYSELSRRYVRDGEEFYVPSEWRSAPENSKQGSGSVLSDNDSQFWSSQLEEYIKMGEHLYSMAIGQNLAPEQARLFLPAYGLYTKYLWTPSLHAALNFVSLRSASDSQLEIQKYSNAVQVFIQKSFPNVWKAYNGSS